MPPSSEQQNLVPQIPAPPLWTPPSAFIKFVRIFLLIPIIIGLGLIATYQIWVPKLVDAIIGKQTSTISPILPATMTPRPNTNSTTISSVIATTTLSWSGHQFTFYENNVYDSGTLLKGVDPFSFVLLTKESAYSFVYFKDKNAVYFENWNSLKILPNADPSTFTQLAEIGTEGGSYDLYGKDKNHVYYDDQILPGEDVSTLIYLGGAFFKDSAHVYADDWTSNDGTLKVIQGADPSTFSIINCLNGTVLAKDASHFYGMTGNVETNTDCAEGTYGQ